MSLSLMYITNNPQIASIAQNSGVDRIFVDMECIGKEMRQAGMNTVKSYHTFSDVEKIKAVTRKGDSQLLVRINPMHEATKEFCASDEEIETVISCGADIIMLPMFRTKREVEQFFSCVNGRAKTILLLETKEAYDSIEEILSIQDIEEIHIGLNDLHLAFSQQFMFEPLANGMVDRVTEKIKEKQIKFGFGGIARVGYGMLPAEYIIAEHYRLGSQMAILSRSFCNANEITEEKVLKTVFEKGISDIRQCEIQAAAMAEEEYKANHEKVVSIVKKIVG